MFRFVGGFWMDAWFGFVLRFVCSGLALCCLLFELELLWSID